MKTSSENQLNRVSKKFYRNIIDRVNDIFSSIATPSAPDNTISSTTLATETVNLIDRYIADGTIAKPSGEMALLAFLMVKPEIDKAADRSRRARQLAARRAQLKQASTTTTIIPTQPSEKTILPEKESEETILTAKQSEETTNLPPQESDSISKPTIKERPSSNKTCSSPKTSQRKKPMKKFGVRIVHRQPAHKHRNKRHNFADERK